MTLVPSTIPLDEILCLVPMKAVEDAKKRLRISFPTQKQGVISNIISKLFLNVITTVKEYVQFAVVSPSEDTLELALDQGASFIYQDIGVDLNDALSTSINYAHTTEKWRYILILTADLPYLTIDSFNSLAKNFLSDSITILAAPSKDKVQGTSGLLFPLALWNNIELQFGIDSFNKFVEQFKKKKITFNTVHDTIGFDLDTIDDLIEYRSQLVSDFSLVINNGELNELFTV